jgi:hypothetical protein
VNVVNPKGGNWLAGSVERAVEPMRAPVRSQEFLTRIADEEARGLTQPGMLESVLQQNSKAEAMNRWLDTKLAKYMRNEMATPEDPLRALAERGVLHVDPQQLNFRQEMHGRYMEPGQTAVAQSPAAKSWEGASDLQVGQMPAGQLLQQGYAEQMPWLAKVPPETPVYMPSQSGIADDLGFNHLVDELRNAINPESGLPRELMLKYSDLEKVTVPQAVERVAKINDWRAAQKAEADMARAMGPATQVVKEYPEQGYKWVELRQPKETGKKIDYLETPDEIAGLDDANVRAMVEEMAEDEGFVRGTRDFEQYVRDMTPQSELKTVDESYKALEDALKYEGETMGHCVGGYCPDVSEGRSKIFSLRDKKGQPHVTIEVAPRQIKNWNDVSDIVGPFESNKLYDEIATFQPSNAYTAFEEFIKSKGIKAPDDIVQIKGKGNKAPKEDYLPAVQDFVRSGNFGKVGDLQNTGLVKFGNEYRTPSELLYKTDEGDWINLADAAKQYFPDSPAKQQNFMQGAVDPSMIGSYIKLADQPEGFARGGAVHGYQAGGAARTLPELHQRYAEGGAVTGANFPTDDYDPARIDAIVAGLQAEMQS